ncbi:cation:dicarboxylase symporter family transporter [Gordonia sp. HY002]|uniref:cation:dicarboxylate symporter family transporter n=1 Tax=Gordonia zhenghanii TaxID=2911516 RepID=UPI001EEF9729|nr:cation:dicarboxylase symporter family transporter [Gordonia zhenghanii]MCF8571743.1 cation:dicarboxylase symporter family transporter [Gordonia zhenghanii]MCF8604932.1 cation:dicarboxylase symporter family transporter [Gordonia zhenghanii]
MRTPTDTAPRSAAPKRKRDRTHFLYIAVIVAVIAGVVVGMVWPEIGKDLKPLGEIFVNLIKMMISPVIFCTIVLGIGSVRKAASVGRIGGLALGYFVVMSTFALGIGILVGNILKPGTGLHVTAGSGAEYAEQAHEGGGTWDFVSSIVPDSMLSALTSGSVLQTLFIALLVGFALQAIGGPGEPILRGIGLIQKLVFRVLVMILWVAPIGAFGAIAAVVGSTGFDAVKQLGLLMLGFYVTCFLFVFVVLGTLLRLVAHLSVFKLARYLAREYLLIVATSSSEAALPRLIAKMEHAGVQKSTVGIVVPTGYSFNLDGTAIYLTMASLFVADAMGAPLNYGEQFSLLLFMMIASKGAAGVTGAGLATLAGGLQSHRPDLLDGVGVIVGIDRFMSEARALTNFSGNAIATILIGTWTKTIDASITRRVLDGEDPFDESSMVDDDEPSEATSGAATVTEESVVLTKHRPEQRSMESEPAHELEPARI